jgi:peptide/nickel transport system substrate-binding protein
MKDNLNEKNLVDGEEPSGENLFVDARKGLNRREFVRLSALLGAGVVGSLSLAACGDATATVAAPAATTAAPAATTAASAATTAASAATTAASATTTAASATTAAATTAASAATTAAAGKAPTGTLTIAQGVDIESLDPYVTTSGASKGIMWTIFDRLVIKDIDFQTQPGLATSWKTLDPNTWELKLRQGVKFHNGEPFDANSVKFSFARFVDPAIKNGYASNLKPVTGVEIVDDYTVHVKTSAPFGDFIETLTGYVEMLPPKAAANTTEFLKTLPGTGPYKFVSWNANDKFVVEAAGPHWNGEPRIKQVTFRPIPDGTARINELKSGGVDLITNVPALQVNSIKNEPGITISRAINSSSIVLIPSFLTTDVFKKKEVRQAMNYAIDKDALIKVVLQGEAVPLESPYAKNIPGGYVPGLPPYKYDPEKAKSLLTAAGYPNGFKFSFKAPNGRHLQDKQVAEAIVGQLAKVGITAELETIEWSTYVQGIIGRKYELFFLSQGGAPVSVNAQTNWSSKIKGIAWQGYTNPQVDDLIEKAGKTVDDKERIALYEQMDKIIWEDCPWIFLYNQQDIYAAQAKVKNFKPTSEAVVRLDKTEVA